MYSKKHHSPNIQGECKSIRTPKTKLRKFKKLWRKFTFKFLFKSIEIFWRFIQVFTTLGGFIYLLLEILRLK